jgi:hypothetical protein
LKSYSHAVMFRDKVERMLDPPADRHGLAVLL